MLRNIFTARLYVFLSDVGSEVLLFLLSELIVRFIIPSPSRRSDRLKLLVIQGCFLAVAVLLLHMFHHKPFVLLCVTIFIFIRLVATIASEPNGAPHVHISKRLRKNTNFDGTSPVHWGQAWGQPTLTYGYQPVSVTHRPNTTTTSGLPQASVGSTLLHRSTAGDGKRMQQISNRTHNPQQVASTRGANYTYSAVVQPQGVADSNTLNHSPQRGAYVGTAVSTRHQDTSHGYPSQSYLQYLSSWLPKKPSECPPGINNSGNVCFINSTLQTLAWTPGFIDNLKIACGTEVSSSSVPTTKVQLLKSLHSVLKQCHVLPDKSTSFSAINSSEFLNAVSELIPYLVAPPQSRHRQTQQDASEFLLWLLDNMEGAVPSSASDVSNDVFTSAKQKKELCHLQLCRANSDDIETYGEPLTELARADWILQSKESSFLTRKLFLGQMIEARECQNCRRMSVNVEYFTVLPLPIPVSQPDSVRRSVLDCFDRFSTVEELNSSNMMVCSCSPSGNDSEVILTRGKRLALLSRLPKRLIIQLTRFSYNTALKCAQKNATPIAIPTTINISPYLMESKLSKKTTAVPSERCKTAVYTLYSLCIHTGAQSTSFGHYLAYCQTSNGVWYLFNDSYVSAVANMEQELQKPTLLRNAYLLYYTAEE